MSFLNRFLESKPRDDDVASVVRNLTHLLNSKSGYGSPLRAFGLGEYLAMAGVRQTAEAVMNEIMRDISQFEPRLVTRDIRVLNDNQLPLAFELRGELRLTHGRPLAPTYELAPCRLAILFNPISGEVMIHPLDVQSGGENVR